MEPQPASAAVLPLTRRRQWCVAVHVGAGYHKPELEPQWRATLSAACTAAAAVLNEPEMAGSNVSAQNDFVPGAMRAVTAALASLEDDARTNAGLGSNLTEGGHVEADARYEFILWSALPRCALSTLFERRFWSRGSVARTNRLLSLVWSCWRC